MSFFIAPFIIKNLLLKEGVYKLKLIIKITDICDKTYRFIGDGKSDQFVPKVSNDICIEILIFVRSEKSEKKVLNKRSDVCDKHPEFRINIQTKLNTTFCLLVDISHSYFS